MDKIILFIILTRLRAILSCIIEDKCVLVSKSYLNLHDTNICYRNRQWYVYGVTDWKFARDQMLVQHFPVDADRRNIIREVRNAIFSVVYPTPLKAAPRLAAVSDEVLLDVLNIDPREKEMKQFLQLANGEVIPASTLPLAHR